MPDFEGVQRVFKETRIALGEILSAFEFFDQEGLDLVLAHTGQKAPFEGKPAGGRAFYVLLETSGSNKDHDDEVSAVSSAYRFHKADLLRSQKLGGLLEHLLESEIVSDGVLAQDETQVASLWSLRESLPEAAGKLGKVYKYDLSMPVKDMYSLVEEARERFRAQGLDMDGSIKATVGYGHIGDGASLLVFWCLRGLTRIAGNLHINIVASRWDEKIEQAIEPWIYEATGAFSCSSVLPPLTSLAQPPGTAPSLPSTVSDS